MKDFLKSRPYLVQLVAAAILLGTGAGIGHLVNVYYPPAVHPDESAGATLTLPDHLSAPTGKITTLKADCKVGVTWLLPPNSWRFAHLLPVGNSCLINPQSADPFDVGCMVISRTGNLGPVWCHVNAAPVPPPPPPPNPPPGPPDPPGPTPAKSKLYVYIVVDYTMISKAHADLIADVKFRQSLTAKGHVVRILEVSSAAVKDLHLGQWINNAGGPPVLILQRAEGANKGVVFFHDVLRSDAASVTKQITDHGGL